METFLFVCLGLYVCYRLSSLWSYCDDLSGKIVWITGASSGIGKACVDAFYREGCTVVMLARRVDVMNQVKDEILRAQQTPQNSHIYAHQIDLEDLESMSEKVKVIQRSCGGSPDILVNSAGVSCRDSVADMTMGVYHRVMGINFFSQVALIKALLPSMIERKSGAIVNVSSIQGKYGITCSSAYGASKHALQGFSDSLRLEMVKNNIHVCVVSPSYVLTNLSYSRLRGDGSAVGEMTADIAHATLRPEQVAQAVVSGVKTWTPDIYLGPIHHSLLIYVHAFSPRLYTALVSRFYKPT